MKKLYIDPKASPQAKQFIQAAQQVLFSVQTMPVLKQMIAGGKSLVAGAAPFVANLVMKLQGKLGPLNDVDLPMVVFHICGYIADFAHDLGDPEAKDTKKITAAMGTAVKQMLDGGQQGQQQQPQQPPQQAPLQQLGGMQ